MPYTLVGVVLGTGLVVLVSDEAEGVWISRPPYASATSVADADDTLDLDDVIDWRKPLRSLAEVAEAVAELQRDLAAGSPDVVVGDIYGSVDYSLAEAMLSRLEAEYMPQGRYADVLEVCEGLLKTAVVASSPDLFKRIQHLGKAADAASSAIGAVAAAERFPG